jgi:hypothetical protein
MRTLIDGHVIQNGLSLTEKPDNGQAVSLVNYPVEAQVLATHSIDDKVNNPNGEAILCDLFVVNLGFYLYNVPFHLPKGSVDNYVHVGNPIAASSNVDGSQFTNSTPVQATSNGDVALVVFVNGDVQNPRIISMYPSRQSGINGVSPSPRPISTDGDCLKIRFNGTNFNIDKSGNVSFVNTATFDKTITKNKKFNIDFVDANANEVSVLLDNSTAGSPEVKISTKDQNGKQSYVDLTGTTMTLQDGNGNKILMTSAGIQIIDCNGNNFTLASSGANLNTSANLIKLDGSVYGTHQHIGNLGAPTSPPLDANSQ